MIWPFNFWNSIFFWHHLHSACYRKKCMVKAPNVPGSEIHNKESRDICDPTVEGHNMLSVPPKQSTSKGRTESHRSSSHVSYPILFSFDLEILWFCWGIISECKFLIQFCAYPRAEKELWTLPLSHNTSQWELSPKGMSSPAEHCRTNTEQL